MFLATDESDRNGLQYEKNCTVFSTACFFKKSLKSDFGLFFFSSRLAISWYFPVGALRVFCVRAKVSSQIFHQTFNRKEFGLHLFAPLKLRNEKLDTR